MTWPFEDPVAEGALELLRSAGFRLRVVDLPDLGPLPVTEDRYSIVGLVVAERWEDVEGRLADLPIAFSNWAAGRGAGARQWDLYLLVLLTANISDEALPDVEAFIADTQFVRRIVRGSLSRGKDALRDALAPFLPVDIGIQANQAAPLDQLGDRLKRAGVDEAIVAGALDSFRETGKVALP